MVKMYFDVGALTLSSMISHTWPESKKQFFQVGLIRVRSVWSL